MARAPVPARPAVVRAAAPRGIALRAALGIALAAALPGCQPTTTRPPFGPYPEAAVAELRLPPTDAITRLADRLRADSVAVRRVEPRDGYLETSWVAAATGRPTRSRPLGPDVVRVRAWADPAQPGYSRITVETVYRPLADPSLPERELDRQVAPEHPIAVRVRGALRELAERHGGRVAESPAEAPAKKPAEPPRRGGPTPRTSSPTPRADGG